MLISSQLIHQNKTLPCGLLGATKKRVGFQVETKKRKSRESREVNVSNLTRKRSSPSTCPNTFSLSKSLGVTKAMSTLFTSQLLRGRFFFSGAFAFAFFFFVFFGFGLFLLFLFWRGPLSISQDSEWCRQRSSLPVKEKRSVYFMGGERLCHISVCI
ncbi:hypothetical protein BDV32DRAFT_25552 [Aspergillus pseudonomiae]|uniref:Uncharacterized protein n=1 Tax=Aspergillus pseudonomiae TaxID=1506151 RepID=A0A5N7CTK0_9EURO|nr:uncharacterized protein BDV37DRAFT_55404 [Aspergillus pseudonomiae]KAB8253885.1 hypothetical protein BDV32DRAFT_25552 [Aspergillus pseudonomiae]KAE8397531.1 hypothetical protein BDV37DRAFT_55404 [Aspergillus pseudonomiae]